MIENRQYRLKISEIPPNKSLLDISKQVLEGEIIRWYISQITSEFVTIEATLYSEPLAKIHESVETQYYPGKSVVINIVPTGIGCSVCGGCHANNEFIGFNR